jgi:predicted glycosyltransferase
MVSGTLLKYYRNPNENFKVFGDERMKCDTQRELLYISDIVVGWSSTMLLESIALYKNVLHVQVGNTVDVGFDSYKDFIPTAYNKKEMIAFLTAPKTDSKSKQLIDKYLYRLDGKTCERIFNTINEHII